VQFVDATWWFREVMLVKSAEELSYCAIAACLASAPASHDRCRETGASEFACSGLQEQIHARRRHAHPFLIMTWGAQDMAGRAAWLITAAATVVEPGDLIMAELFPAMGLETQQQMAVASRPSRRSLPTGRSGARCYDAGVAALRPGRHSATHGAHGGAAQRDRRLVAHADDP